MACYHEVRGDSWGAAASQLVADIALKGLQRGQMVWVDAHNNGPDCQAIFSAHWSSEQSEGQQPLDLQYHQVESAPGGEWPELYDKAVEFCAGLQRGQLVSLTCSCSLPAPRCFVFFDARRVPEAPALELGWIQSSAGSWSGSAEQLKCLLSSAQVPTETVVGIDAHNTDPDGAALLVAVYDKAACGTAGSEELYFVSQNSGSYGWDQFYLKAMQWPAPESPIAITSSCNCNGRGVCFTWWAGHTALPAAPQEDSQLLRVMTFNIWRNGGDSLERTADVIRTANPDIVGLQECSLSTAKLIASFCGLHALGNGSSGTSVLSRWPGESLAGSSNSGWRLRMDSRWVLLFNVHLAHHPYPPYVLHCDQESPAEAEAVEAQTQLPGLLSVLGEIDSACAAEPAAPLFLTGDFNCASHKDYWGLVAWPCSMECEARGLSDSFSEAREREVAEGSQTTWSPKPEEEERGVHDRIDFVYHSTVNANTELVRSVTLDGTNSGVELWPSDHRAVLSVFRLL